MAMGSIASWCVLAVTAAWLVARAPRHRAAIAAVAALACATLAASQLVWRARATRAAAARAELAAALPRPTRSGGYVTSDACRACHPHEHASWHQSYHRTMTQAASPTSIRGRFDGTTLSDRGRAVRLERRGDEFWARIEGAADERIAMVTGSHHMQVYWTRGGGGNALVEFPFTWLIDEARWVPRADTFLLSPDHAKAASTWNATCIECHATAGQPRLDADPGAPDTRVAELGIACEACHGPARVHIEANESPLRRASLRRAGAGDRTIVNPARLTPVASAEVCGQCHGIGCNLEGWKSRGLDYRPGGELEQHKPSISPAAVASSPCKAYIEARPDWLVSRFWSDGVVRVTGREHSQMVGSACFRGGGLSCLACHSMHDSDPDDQLAEGMDGDRACGSCHEAIAARPGEHTHHAADSEGSRCYNCHMPYTTYGLLKAVRTHRIDSPRVEEAAQSGRPNACNQCHLDKTLAWTARMLASWYGQSVPDLDEDRTRIAESVIQSLTGDAGQRALAVWTMGWSAAHRASGSDWLAPHVIDRLDDRYAAVRAIAARSLRALPGFAALPYDYVAPPAERASAAAQALSRWRGARRADAPPRPAVLLGPGPGLLDSEWDRLAARRDDPPMFLAE